MCDNSGLDSPPITTPPTPHPCPMSFQTIFVGGGGEDSRYNVFALQFFFSLFIYQFGFWSLLIVSLPCSHKLFVTTSFNPLKENFFPLGLIPPSCFEDGPCTDNNYIIRGQWIRFGKSRCFALQASKLLISEVHSVLARFLKECDADQLVRTLSYQIQNAFSRAE